MASKYYLMVMKLARYDGIYLKRNDARKHGYNGR
jgi:hypothetical protein